MLTPQKTNIICKPSRIATKVMLTHSKFGITQPMVYHVMLT